jgi:hypothetical protein
VSQTGSNILRCCQSWIALISGYAPVSHLHTAILYRQRFAQLFPARTLLTTPNCLHTCKTSIEIVSFAPPRFRAQPLSVGRFVFADLQLTRTSSQIYVCRQTRAIRLSACLSLGFALYSQESYQDCFNSTHAERPCNQLVTRVGERWVFVTPQPAHQTRLTLWHPVKLRKRSATARLSMFTYKAVWGFLTRAALSLLEINSCVN